MTVAMEKQKESLTLGHVLSVRGSVVDIWFEHNLPTINTLIYTGSNMEIAIEILAQLDDNRVRGIALTPTQGLARGMIAETAGKQLSVPIGSEILGRMFDVFGNTIDHGPALPTMKRRSVHQSPPPLGKRSTKSMISSSNRQNGFSGIQIIHDHFHFLLW